MKKNLLTIVFFLSLTSINAQVLKPDSVMMPYKYLVHIPAKTAADGKYPLLLFLHGAGERGNDLNKIRTTNPLAFYKDSLNFPFLMIAPQCPEGQSWNPEILIWLLDEIEKKYPVDKERIYVTGLSMGGRGTWALAKKAGDRFAAIVTVCGGVVDTKDVCMLRHLPVWAFHGDKDDTVPFEESVNPIKVLQAIGAEAKLTMYPGVKHDSWINAYADSETYEWLLQHKRFGKALELSETDKKQYVGKYVYTTPGNGKDTLNTFVVLEKGSLWYSVPRNAFKVKMYAVANDLFRLEGISLQPDSELFFVRDAKNKITGHRYYPCDDTFVPKQK